MNHSEEAQCVLILDLSSDNPINVPWIEGYLQPARYRAVYRVTDFGAERAPQGGAPSQRVWRDWTAAVDLMLKRAREDLGANQENVHYYVAGRAGLPLFAYLGLRLGKQAPITMVNQRDDHALDIVPFQQSIGTIAGEPDRERFFNIVRGMYRDEPSLAKGRVAVFISTQRDSDREAINAFAESLDVPLADIVTVRARPVGGDSLTVRTLLEAGDGPRAARELVEHFTAIQDSFPRSNGLIVYIAGPATLAAMVGRAMNPRIHSPVWLPNFRDRKYEPAVEIPWPLVSGGKPRILVLVANIADEKGRRVDMDRELRGMFESLGKEMDARRCELRYCPAVRVRDVMNALRDFKPHLLHFIGHGNPQGLCFTREDGSKQRVLGEDLCDILAQSKVDDLKLVVLNACQSDEIARKLTSVVNCAIGTVIDLPNEHAILFARRFYDDLVHGWSVPDAFERARVESRVETGNRRVIFDIKYRDGIDHRQLVIFSPADPDR
jgi:hypothetical protein